MSNYYTPEQLAELWGVSVNTLRKWRWEGKGPKFIKLGAKVTYRASDIEAYADACAFSSTSEFGPNGHTLNNRSFPHAG